MALAASPARKRVSVDWDVYQGRRVNGSKTQLPPAVLSRIPDTKTARRAIKWTPEEDAALLEAVRKYGEVWTRVAADVATRTNVQCSQRWNKTLRPGLVRGKWSAEEDAALISALAEFADDDEVDWRHVASKVNGRNAKQCKERFQLKLDPALKRDEWTAEEDALLLASFEKCNGRWTAIAKSLPGRREDAVKIRFRSLQRQASRVRQWTLDEDVAIVQWGLAPPNGAQENPIIAKRSKRTKSRRFHELSDKHPLIKRAFEREASLSEHEIRRLLSIGSPPSARSSVAVAGSPLPFAWSSTSQPNGLTHGQSLGSIPSMSAAAPTTRVPLANPLGATLAEALSNGKKLRATARFEASCGGQNDAPDASMLLRDCGSWLPLSASEMSAGPMATFGPWC